MSSPKETRHYTRYEIAQKAVLNMLHQPRTMGEITTGLAEKYGTCHLRAKNVIRRMVLDELIDFRVIGNMVIYWKTRQPRKRT